MPILKYEGPDESKFIINYRYNGIIRSATVEEVRLSYTTLYRLKSDKHSWNLQKKDNGKWQVTSPHQLNADLLKAIGEGIDIYLSSK